MQQITVTELAALDSPTLIDVREADEYAQGHVPGAVSTPLSRFLDELRHVPTGRPVHVICQSGGRSARATEMLQQLGIDAIDIAGGTSAWRRAGFQVEAA